MCLVRVLGLVAGKLIVTTLLEFLWACFVVVGFGCCGLFGEFCLDSFVC